MGNTEKANGHIERLKTAFPAWVDQTREMIRQIAEGTHPAFPKE